MYATLSWLGRQHTGSNPSIRCIIMGQHKGQKIYLLKLRLCSPNSEAWLILAIRTHEVSELQVFNTLRPRQDGRHFPDDILKYIFLNESV